MKRDMRKAIVLMALAAAASVALLSVAPASAEANGCWNRGPDRTRTFATGTQEHYRTWYCSAYQSNEILNSRPMGVLFAGTSWFVCQQNWPGYPNPRVGSAQNTWWLYTLGDRAAGPEAPWGWFPATKIRGGGNFQRIPGNLPTCNTVAGSHVTVGRPADERP